MDSSERTSLSRRRGVAKSDCEFFDAEEKRYAQLRKKSFIFTATIVAFIIGENMLNLDWEVFGYDASYLLYALATGGGVSTIYSDRKMKDSTISALKAEIKKINLRARIRQIDSNNTDRRQ